MKKKLLTIIILSIIFFSPFKINADEFIVKWMKTFGGNEYDIFYDVALTEENEIIAIGGYESTNIDDFPNVGFRNAMIIKYDVDGNALWKKSWGGNDSDVFYQIILTKDGFVVVGSFTSTNIDGMENKGCSDAIIIKYDKDGNLLWQKNWGGTGNDEFTNLIQTEDENFYVVGKSTSTDIDGIENKGSEDAVIVKYDKNGNLIWQKNWGGNDNDKFDNLIVTDDGVVVIGDCSSLNIERLENKGSIDAVIVKYDKNGNLIWQKNWGGDGNDMFNGIVQTKSGNYVVVGENNSFIEGLTNMIDLDAMIIEFDKNGNLIWQKSWGGNAEDELVDILSKDDGFISLGITMSRDIEGLNVQKNVPSIIMVKFNENGEVQWQKKLATLANCYGRIALTKNGEYVAYGYWFENQNVDAAIIKFMNEYYIETPTTPNGESIITYKGNDGLITPKPAEGYEVDQIIIKDTNGNVLKSNVKQEKNGTYSFEIYTDVSVEVTFKEKIDNPKTGILDVMTILIIGFLMSITGFFIVKNYSERLEI